MNTKVKFLCRRADEPVDMNFCLEDMDELVNGWLERNPCNILDIKYNEVVSYYLKDGEEEHFKFPYTKYISVMIIYNDDI